MSDQPNDKLFAEAIRCLDQPGKPPTTPYDPGDHWCGTIIKRATNRAVHFKNHQAKRPMPNIIIGHVEDPEFNAVAFCHPTYKELFIAVNGGASIVVEQLFWRLLSEPGVMSWIGDSSIERPGAPFKITTNAQELAELFARDHIDLNDRRPKDEKRQCAAWLLSALAMEYLLEHELTHVEGGHLGYLSRLLGLSLIQEAYGLAGDKAVAMQLQALEMEADCLSAIHTFHTAIGFCEDKKGLLSGIISSIDDALFFSQFAIYCTWRLFGYSLPEEKDWKSMDHPPLRMREIMMRFTLMDSFKNHVPADGWLDRYGKQFENVLYETEIGFARIQGCEPLIEDTKHIYSSAVQQHIQEIRETCYSMQTELAKETY